jgi:SAM-dependent methyltransferase
MTDRSVARRLAAEYIARGDATGWFEPLYRAAEAGSAAVPWADLRPNPNVVSWAEGHRVDGTALRALKVGCGFGDDAEYLRSRGFSVVAFDIAETAIAVARRRFPASTVEYRALDLFALPADFAGAFDLVLESYTLQVLPEDLRRHATTIIASLVRRGGRLVVVARARDPDDPAGTMPWPLTRDDLLGFTAAGLEEVSFEDYVEAEQPPVRRFRAVYRRA